MAIRILNEIRTALLDPTQQGQEKREEIINKTSELKGYASVGMGVFGLVAVVSLVAIPSFPVIGIVFAMIGSAGMVAAHDAGNMVANTEEMMRAVFTRGIAELSENTFITRLTRDTWVIGPLFASQMEAILKHEEFVYVRNLLEK